MSHILNELQTLLYKCEKNEVSDIEDEEDEEEEEELRQLGPYIHVIYYFRSLSPSAIDKQVYSINLHCDPIVVRIMLWPVRHNRSHLPLLLIQVLHCCRSIQKGL